MVTHASRFPFLEYTRYSAQVEVEVEVEAEVEAERWRNPSFNRRDGLLYRFPRQYSPNRDRSQKQ